MIALHGVALYALSMTPLKQRFICNFRLIEVPALPGESLLDVALKSQLPLHHSCGGMGTCGTCRVIIREGLEWLPPPNEIEQEMIQDRGFPPAERLACQLEVEPRAVVIIPEPRK